MVIKAQKSKGIVFYGWWAFFAAFIFFGITYPEICVGFHKYQKMSHGQYLLWSAVLITQSMLLVIAGVGVLALRKWGRMLYLIFLWSATLFCPVLVLFTIPATVFFMNGNVKKQFQGHSNSASTPSQDAIKIKLLVE